MTAFPALLAGIRVLDASRVLAGPFCGQLLGDLGADVIKIERPGSGDDTRTWGPPFLDEGTSAYYLSCNRNKRGITLDMARPEGQEAFRRLAAGADVVLENFLPGAAKKLGLTPQQLLAVNPRLVVCSISGFGRAGPWADRPGYDFAIQAMSGLMSITGLKQGPPVKVGVAVADVLTGLYAAAAVLAGLIARGRTGHGYAIDLSLLDCAVAAQVNLVQAFLTRMQNGQPPEEAAPKFQGNEHSQIVPYQLFATADGWLVLAVGNDKQWQHFSSVACPELGHEERYATNPGRVVHREELVPLLADVLRKRTTGEWIRVLDEVGVPCAPLWSYAELFRQPIAEARGFQVRVHDPSGREVGLCGSPVRVGALGEVGAFPPAACPPRLGQHTDEVLREAGFRDEEIAGLREKGVV